MNLESRNTPIEIHKIQTNSWIKWRQFRYENEFDSSWNKLWVEENSNLNVKGSEKLNKSNKVQWKPSPLSWNRISGLEDLDH